MKINKTNAARLLDKAKITYELIPYEVDENDLSAVHVAASLGENIEQVFKTLVLHGEEQTMCSLQRPMCDFLPCDALHPLLLSFSIPAHSQRRRYFG